MNKKLLDSRPSVRKKDLQNGVQEGAEKYPKSVGVYPLSTASALSLSPTAEFLEEDVELLQAKGHKVERTELLSLVEGTRRTNDLIIGVKDPRSADASALTMSNMP